MSRNVLVIGKSFAERMRDVCSATLFGPGRTNEHVDPHLAAGFGEPSELAPVRRSDGRWDLRRLSGVLAQPLVATLGSNYDKPVWHCSVRAAPGDRLLADEEWGDIADAIPG